MQTPCHGNHQAQPRSAVRCRKKRKRPLAMSLPRRRSQHYMKPVHPAEQRRVRLVAPDGERCSPRRLRAREAAEAEIGRTHGHALCQEAV
eukprot:4522575-Pleurochrysis_carterae.AAC.5